jgi:hypothetical protein
VPEPDGSRTLGALLRCVKRLRGGEYRARAARTLSAPWLTAWAGDGGAEPSPRRESGRIDGVLAVVIAA